MKKINNTFKYFFVLFLIVACAEDLRELDFASNIAAPSNLEAVYNISQDNTGLVTITPSADGANNFDIFFGDATTEPENIKQGENIAHTYSEGTYDIKVIAYNINGDETELTQQLVVSFKAPQNLVVVLENDPSVSKQVNITANAEFASMFEFYSGETGVTQPALTGNIGDKISYKYPNPGIYSVKVIAKGGAIETTEYTEDFEVTEILAPTQAAPTSPNRAATDVISIFSDVYTNQTLNELPTSWSETNFEATTIDSDNVWKLTSLDFLGIVTNYANGIDVSSMETLHIDYWVPEGTTNELLVKIVNTIDGGEDVESLGTTVGGSWQSIDIDMTGFDGGNLTNKEKITQILIDSDGIAGVVYVDNFYFYKAPTTFPNISDDFEGNGTITTWYGDGNTTIDTSFDNPFIDGTNASAKVLKYNDSGDQYANIGFNTSPNFDLSVKNKFSLKIYVASSDITGSSPNQIALKLQDGTVAQPWVQQSEIIKPIQLDTWQTVSFDFANDPVLGAANPISRTDFNRVVLQVNGENNNDNVIAYFDDFAWGDDLFTGPIPNDSFEGNGNITDWYGDGNTGINTSFDNPFNNADNSSDKVLQYSDTGDQYANIGFNLDTNFNMEKYTFSLKIYVSSSDVSGSLPNQISLKLQDGTVSQPWVQQTEIIQPIQLDTWQTVTFDFKNGTTLGAANPLDRTDFNRVVLQVNGENNTETVTAYIDDFKYQ